MIKGLGLSKVGDNVIGTVLKRGLSGGEKRRTTVGQELVVKQAMAFLGESVIDQSSVRVHCRPTDTVYAATSLLHVKVLVFFPGGLAAWIYALLPLRGKRDRYTESD